MWGQWKIKVEKERWEKNKTDVPYWNCRENGRVKSQCVMLMADNGKKGMNMTEEFDGDTLICLVGNSIESIGIEFRCVISR